MANVQAAARFAEKWSSGGHEEQDKERFWLEFLQKVLGVKDVYSFITFEKDVFVSGVYNGPKVKDEQLEGQEALDFGYRNPGRRSTKKRIDAFVPSTRILIEQKSSGIPLDKPLPQSDGDKLTPIEQAERYCTGLGPDEAANFIITCNFDEFWIYDLRHRKELILQPVAKIRLSELPAQLQPFDFITAEHQGEIRRQENISKDIAQHVAKLYRYLTRVAQQHEVPRHDMIVLLMRLVFCMYAEDSGLFPNQGQFFKYLEKKNASEYSGEFRQAIIELFRVLNTPYNDRDPFLPAELKAFPYVNGGLFAEAITVPLFTQTEKNELLLNCSAKFNWSSISPAVFGSIFETLIDVDTRRRGGMHFTAPENIHKVIDPLFLDRLHDKFAAAYNDPYALKTLHDEIAALKLFDPACGSGNFLTVSYLCLRDLELAILERLYLPNNEGRAVFAMPEQLVRVSVDQFFGIEIDELSSKIARTALWIAEHQANRKVCKRFGGEVVDTLPIKTHPNIVHGNALTLEWGGVLPADECDYIMGNPPFVGYSNHTKEQQADRERVFGKNCKVLDYVACWYKKAADYIEGQHIRCAFVSTNSICQGQQVEPLWKPLFDSGIHIDFAWPTFVWGNEMTDAAHVHVVIVGFSRTGRGPRRLFSEEGAREVANINGYLAPAPNVFLSRRSKPLCDVPEMVAGGKPSDGGHLILSPEERGRLLKADPAATKWIRPFSMGAEFINGKDRYCLWLVDAHPSDLRSMPKVAERVNQVREMRLASPKAATRKKAETPWLFDEVRPPEGESYLAIPAVSSGRRKYMPLGFVTNGMIPGNKLYFVANASLYDFGILMSQMHSAWMRVVAGRLKSDYNYANTIVYNNFIWPDATEQQRLRIEAAAQAVLDARAAHPGCTYADLYDPVFMPSDLRVAHARLDSAVEAAYGVSFNGDEEAMVAHLFQLYAQAAGD